MLLLGIGMMLIGFGFKIAAVPFHMWTPDAYEGAPTPITAYMATGVKLAAFADSCASSRSIWRGQRRLVVGAMGGRRAHDDGRQRGRAGADQHQADAGILGDRARRISAGGDGGGGAARAPRCSTTWSATWSRTSARSRWSSRWNGAAKSRNLIEDFRGLAARQPGLAGAMAIFLLSFTGVPPLVGFVGKFYIFSGALQPGYVGLVVIAVLNSVVAAYYYIYVLSSRCTCRRAASKSSD